MKLLSVLCCRDVFVRRKVRPDMFVVMSGLFTRVACSLYTGLSVQRKVRPDMFPSSLFGVSGRPDFFHFCI